MKRITRNSLIAALSVAALSSSVHAGVITQFTGFDNFIGTCPGVSSPGYVSQWGEAIASFQRALTGGDFSASQINADTACVFNRNRQALYWNQDGTVKEQFQGFGLVNGAPFTSEQVGSLVIDTASGTTATIAGSIESGSYGSMRLLEEALGLPEIKVYASAGEHERRTVNGFAATEYVWTGETQDLRYLVNFDFFMSDSELAIDGAISTSDSGFGISAGISTGMDFSNITYAVDAQFTGNLLVSDGFTLSLLDTDFDRSGYDAENPFESALEINFTVNNGDRFFLWASTQAVAVRGGLLNAANTVTTDLRLAGDETGEESAALFAQALRIATPTSVNSPATLSVILVVLAGLFGHRRIFKQ